jgi:hypothetical protein
LSGQQTLLPAGLHEVKYLAIDQVGIEVLMKFLVLLDLRKVFNM